MVVCLLRAAIFFSSSLDLGTLTCSLGWEGAAAMDTMPSLRSNSAAAAYLGVALMVCFSLASILSTLAITSA